MDVAVMNDFLDLICESQTWELAAFDGDPKVDGVELTDVDSPGYGRTTILPADWAPAADGQKAPTVPAAFPAPEDAWLEPSHWALFRTTDGALGPSSEMAEPVEWPTEASGTGPQIVPVVFFSDAVEADV
jgi:hypothetical protein